jgi:hypothetical protein
MAWYIQGTTDTRGESTEKLKEMKEMRERGRRGIAHSKQRLVHVYTIHRPAPPILQHIQHSRATRWPIKVNDEGTTPGRQTKQGT